MSPSSPRLSRGFLAVAVVILALPSGAGAAPRTVATASRPPAVTYRAPVTPVRVLRAFAPPAVRYGPGHLGVDLAADEGAAVRSAGAGTVTFAGSVAGRGLVVVAHPDGVRTEYEPLAPSVHAGAGVAIGTVLGVVRGRHAGCAAACLHWGARRGATYLDPLSLLRPLGPVRLLPWSGNG